MEKNLKIAITGGIGSGKSLVSKIIENQGYTVYSADKIVSELYEKRELKLFLKSLFPTAVSDEPELTIDRKKISEQAFNDKEKHKKLTDTVTDLVIKELNSRLRNSSGTVFAEVPLLFECNCQNDYDKILVITRNKQDRINSVVLRSNLSEQEVLARMKNQVDYDALDLSNYYVIENNGTENELKEKVLKFLSIQQNGGYLNKK